MTPFYQWDANNGYCGEVFLIQVSGHGQACMLRVSIPLSTTSGMIHVMRHELCGEVFLIQVGG